MAKLKKSEKRLVVLAGSALVSFVLNQFVCGDAEKPQIETAAKIETKSRAAQIAPPKVMKKNQPRPVSIQLI